MKSIFDFKLVGQRVCLYFPRKEAYVFLGDLYSDKLLMRYLVNLYKKEYSKQEIEQLWERHLKENRAQKGLKLAVYHKEDEKIIGFCGFGMLDLKEKKANAGVVLKKEYWGNGYALECMFLCWRYAFEKLDIKEISANTLLSNKRACRFFDLMGMRKVQVTTEIVAGHKYENVVLYSFDCNDWKKNKSKLMAMLKKRV